MVLLLETHKENNNPFKIPGFTLAGHTNTPGRQHGILAGIDWAGDLNWAASTRKKIDERSEPSVGKWMENFVALHVPMLYI